MSHWENGRSKVMGFSQVALWDSKTAKHVCLVLGAMIEELRLR